MTLIMRAELIPMEEKDLEMILSWRNHESVAKWSAGKIPMERHLEWFSFSNPHRYIFILKDKPAGFVKFEPQERGGHRWSFYLNPFEKHPKGAATIMLSMALAVFYSHMGEEPIMAECHHDNHASLRLHKKFGFEEFEPDGDFRRFIKWPS